MSSSSSDSEVKVKKIKKEDKPTTKKEKKVEDIQSSEDEEKDLKILNKKTKRDKKEKKEKKEKKKDSDDESDSDSVEVIAKNTKKKIESDSDSDSEQMKPQKKVKKEEKKSEKKPEKKPQKKIESESEDEDEKSNSEEKPKKGQKKSEKKPVIKNGMSDSDEESDSEPKQKSKPKKEKEQKKEQKKEEEESQEENGAKATAKKEEESEEEKENEEELPENVYEELFVRNIGYNTTEEELADYFAKYGDVEVVKIVTDKNTGKSRGFGFLKFYEKKSAFEAMKDADNIIVGERNLQIRYSNDKGSQMKGGNGGNNSAKKGPLTEFGIFVGNISYKCTENDLKKFFKDCGKVVDVRIAKKPDGKLKGFAHVDFETKEGMEKAVEKNGKELQGRALKIDQSTSGGNKKGGNFGNKGQGRGNRRDNNSDPMAKAKKTGGIIAPTENKVTTYDDSDDE